MTFVRPAEVRQRKLTPIQVQVLKLASEGKMDKEIAQALSSSVGGVSTAMRRILLKLEARNRTQAVAMAIRRGII